MLSPLSRCILNASLPKRNWLHLEKTLRITTLMFSQAFHIQIIVERCLCENKIEGCDEDNYYMIIQYTSEIQRSMGSLNPTIPRYWSYMTIELRTYISCPKADQLEVPCWVNDYLILNSNTILDAHPLPQVDDILANCAKRKIWLKLDMTNSFFSTLVHPDNILLTTVMAPL